MNTIRYVWRHRSWKLAKILYRTYRWPIHRTTVFVLLLLVFLAEILRTPGWGGR